MPLVKTNLVGTSYFSYRETLVIYILMLSLIPGIWEILLKCSLYWEPIRDFSSVNHSKVRKQLYLHSPLMVTLTLTLSSDKHCEWFVYTKASDFCIKGSMTCSLLHSQSLQRMLGVILITHFRCTSAGDMTLVSRKQLTSVLYYSR